MRAEKLHIKEPPVSVINEEERNSSAANDPTRGVGLLLRQFSICLPFPYRSHCACYWSQIIMAIPSTSNSINHDLHYPLPKPFSLPLSQNCKPLLSFSMRTWCSSQGQRACLWGGTEKPWGHFLPPTTATLLQTPSNTTETRYMGQYNHPSLIYFTVGYCVLMSVCVLHSQCIVLIWYPFTVHACAFRCCFYYTF